MSKRITETQIVSILKEADEESRRLKQMYAYLSLKLQMPEEIIKKL